MAFANWTFANTGSAAASSSATTPISGTNSLLLEITANTHRVFGYHVDQGAVTKGRIKTLLKISSGLKAAHVVGLAGMYQSTSMGGSGPNAYYLVIKGHASDNDTATTMYLYRGDLNSTISGTPLAQGSIATVQLDTLFAMELEWQYDVSNSKVAIFGRFGSNLDNLVTRLMYVDATGSGAYTTSLGCGPAAASGSATTINARFDTTSIFGV